MPEPDAASLAWENSVVLAAVQALLGLVTPNLLGVALEFDGDQVTIHFAVDHVDEQTEDDVADAVGDVEGLLWPQEVKVSSRLRQTSAGLGWVGRQHRLVLLAKT